MRALYGGLHGDNQKSIATRTAHRWVGVVRLVLCSVTYAIVDVSTQDKDGRTKVKGC